MAKGSKKWWYLAGLVVCIIYIFIAPRHIPIETVLRPRWITSLESNYPEGIPSVGSEGTPDEPGRNMPVKLGDFSSTESGWFLPFTLGNRFGYLRDDGKFSVNQVRNGFVSISENAWAEYEALPASIQVMNPMKENVLLIENPKGYPLFLDKRVFIVGNEQNYITALDPEGKELWTYDYPAPITCVDASQGYLLAGTLDGTVVLLDSSGTPVFTPFEPGGSRLSVILGCAISSDASRLAIISGIDKQRFLLLEHAGLEPRSSRTAGGVSGDTYRVVYHEFLTDGFRRPVRVSFADNDTKIIFEREGGLGIYNISSRTSTNLSLEGELVALDNSGEDGFLFAITSQGPEEKRFIAIRYPGLIVNEAHYRSGNAFFARRGRQLYLGGDTLLASFELEKM